MRSACSYSVDVWNFRIGGGFGSALLLGMGFRLPKARTQSVFLVVQSVVGLAPQSLNTGAELEHTLCACDCSGSRPRVVIELSRSGCEGSVRDRAVLRAAGGARGGPGTDHRPAAGAGRRAGQADRGVEAAAGRLLAQLVEAAVE